MFQKAGNRRNETKERTNVMRAGRKEIESGRKSRRGRGGRRKGGEKKGETATVRESEDI